jgi:hypothetical protein
MARREGRARCICMQEKKEDPSSFDFPTAELVKENFQNPPVTKCVVVIVVHQCFGRISVSRIAHLASKLLQYAEAKTRCHRALCFPDSTRPLPSRLSHCLAFGAHTQTGVEFFFLKLTLPHGACRSSSGGNPSQRHPREA